MNDDSTMRDRVLGTPGTPETDTGWSRGGLLFALMEALGLLLLFVPLPTEQEVQIVIHVGAILAFLSYPLWALLDRSLRHRGVKDSTSPPEFEPRPPPIRGGDGRSPSTPAPAVERKWQ